MADDALLTTISCTADPDNPGWLRWRVLDDARLNEAVLGPQIVRRESADSCRHRMVPSHVHGNANGKVHGGVLLSLMDVSLFSTLYVLRGIDAGQSVTIDLQAQFIPGGELSRPLDAVVDVLRETGRMAFLRGLIVQDEDLVASFSATVRKPSRK